MRSLPALARLPLFLLLLAVVVRGDPTLSHARQAQVLLGVDAWSRVIRIENTAVGGRYPREFHALVFELAGLLWFYTSVDGTQSLSLHVGQLEAEKSDFGPLLREIDSGFARWRAVEGADVPVKPHAPLPNGCVIESVVALRNRLGRGEAVRNPRLLFYYIATLSGVAGHTVLAYDERGSIAVHDSAQPNRRIRLPLKLGADPLALARAFEGPRVARARELSLESLVPAMIARAGAAAGKVPPA